MSGYVQSGAVISPCGNYRYRLWREWRLHPLPAKWDMWTDDDGAPVLDGAGQQLGEPLSVLFVMLNPSTADAQQDDPTIRRCVAYAKAWGYDRMEVVNLFAWRATDPRAVLAMTGGKIDPVGPANKSSFLSAIERAGMIVCAWGAHGGHIRQDETALGWLEDLVGLFDRDIPITALRTTKGGFPGHPLYLPADLQPIAYTGRASA